MAVVDLNLVVLHRSLVVLYRALVLQHELFLVIQDLLRDGVARPRGAVAFQVHLCLGEHIFVSLQRPLRLQKRCAVRTRIDVNQRIALTYPLTLREMHGNDQAIHLAGDRIGIDRRDRADGVQVDADIALLRRRGRNGDPDHLRVCRSSRRFLGGLVMAPDQYEREQQDQRQQIHRTIRKALCRGRARAAI